MSPLERFRLFFLAAMVALLAACATPIDQADQSISRIDALARDIQQLSPTIGFEEAYAFAKVAVETSAELGRKYDVKLVPWLHNASVVVGMKDRGLCYEYARDLYASLKFVDSRNLAMHFVQANRGKLNEHHALAVTVKGAEWSTGLVLDAWRGGGNLYSGPVGADKYPWLYERRDASFANTAVAGPE
jgi:hypothetical protein